MKYLLLGAGLQGTAVAFDLLNQAQSTATLTVVDASAEALTRLAARLSDERLHTLCADVQDRQTVLPLIRETDVVISAVNYWYNVPLTEWAIDGGAHFLDLGGNNDVVERQFGLDQAARQRGVTVIPDCGLAPGLAGILGYDLHAQFQSVTHLRLRVGGLPRRPQPPLNYALFFAVQGLINEYVEPAVVIRAGEVQTIPSLTELETIVFPEPFGEMEAFQTSGGVSTLPRTLLGKVDNLDYKTIRYKGHCTQFRLLQELGFCGEEAVETTESKIIPRELLGVLLERNLGFSDDDVVLLLAEAEGQIADPDDPAGQPSRRGIRIVDYADVATGMSAMMRMTGYPAAIIAHLLAAGQIAQTGVQPQELIVPAATMIAELERRGVAFARYDENPGAPHRQ